MVGKDQWGRLGALGIWCHALSMTAGCDTGRGRGDDFRHGAATAGHPNPMGLSSPTPWTMKMATPPLRLAL